MTEFEEQCGTFGYVPKGRPLTTEEAAAFLSKHPVTLNQWRLKGIGPRWFRSKDTAKSVYYAEPDLLAWLVNGERATHKLMTVDRPKGGATPPWLAAAR